MDTVTVTDTIPTVQKTKESAKFRVVSVAPILAEVIKRVHDEVSISCLFL
jgi:ribose-phosphate pyrophosphokinase